MGDAGCIFSPEVAIENAPASLIECSLDPRKPLWRPRICVIRALVEREFMAEAGRSINNQPQIKPGTVSDLERPGKTKNGMKKHINKIATLLILLGIFLAATAARANFTVPLKSGAQIKFVWVGDLNGDGKPDYVVDRQTNPQLIEAYTDSGTYLWTVNFGPNSANQDNISPGSATIDVGHNDGVTVADVNGDGKAEVIIKIANGVKFGDGTTWVNSDNNKQWIAVLNGATGKLLKYCSIPTDYISIGPLACRLGIGNGNNIFAFMKNRNSNGSFNCMVCCFQMSSSLTLKWKWLRGSQNCPDGHNSRICDVNGDGIDDFCEIGFVLNGSNGSLLYSLATTGGVVHGDRWHIAKMDSSRAGLQGYGIQQNNSSGLYDYYYDARNGSMIWKHMFGNTDVGRGDCGDIDGSKAGYECWAFNGVYNAKSNTQLSPAGTEPWPSQGIWFDTDDLREQFNDGKIEKYNPASTSTGRRVTRLVTCWNYETATGYGVNPLFHGDYIGDWREEVIMQNSSFNKLVVFTPSGTPATSRANLWNDRYYKNDLTVKGYMQTHHTSYYLGK
jgi:rhamnogalacturonan endolyase